jgi:TPR repeat protein
LNYKRLLFGFVLSLSLISTADAGFLDGLTEKLTRSTSDPGKMEKKCRQGNTDRCWPAGLAYQTGNVVAIDLVKAAELFALGCRGGEFNGCKSLHDLGRQYLDGEEVSQDKARALELFLLACEGDPSDHILSALSCAVAGNLKYRGNGVAQDQVGAVDLYRRGCDYGSNYSCKKFADELYSGKVVAQNFSEAVVAYAKACVGKNSNVHGCTSAGLLYLEGKGTKIDQEKAAFYFDLGCQFPDTHGRSCYQLGKLYQQGVIQSGDPEIVLKLYRQACRISDYEWPEACLAVANLYKNGDGVQRDQNMEREYYNYGCRRNVEEACRLRCELSCQDGQHWGCKSIETGNIPIGVASCISDASQMVSPEMQEVLENYWKTNPEEAENLKKLLLPETQ